MKIVVIEPLGVDKQILDALKCELLPQDAELIYYEDRAESPEELIRRGRTADVVVVANQPLPAEVIRGFENLKMLSVAFTGYDHIAMDACKEKGVVVCNCAGYSTAAVADLVFGLLISLYRHIRECDQRIRQGETKAGLIGPELEGKKFGVIGTGAIGSRVASIARAFGCEVYAYSRTPKALDEVRYTGLNELLEQCDIVSVHVPLNEQTKGMIGREQLNRMKKNAVLINTARGPVVDSEALAQALTEGEIAGCGIDVFEQEPPIQDHPLYHTPNTLLTPHVAFATTEALIKRARIAYANITGWIQGRVQNRVG